MVWRRMAVTAFAIMALAVGGRLAADEPAKTEPPAKGHDRLDAMAAKLGLTDQQKNDIRTVHAEFDKKLSDAEHQVWTLHHEEREAMSKVLTDEQRTKMPMVLKAARDKELQEIAGKLGLTDDQKKKLEAVREEHEQKFHEAAAQQGDEGRGRYRDLRRVFYEAIGKELTDDQRAKLPGVLREEYQEWRDPATRREHLKAISDELGLTAEQKDSMKKIHDEYDQKTEKPAAELKQLRADERAAVDKVLTDEQRAKVQEMRKARESGEAPGSGAKKPGT